MKMHNEKECEIKCEGLTILLKELRVHCLLDQDYTKLDRVESALQLIGELKGEFDVKK